MKTRHTILIVTDSAALPSGMAETTRLIFSTLLDRYPEYYEIHQLGLFHCYAVTKPRWPIYPTMTERRPGGEVWFAPEDKYGQKTFPRLAAKLRPDIVFGYGETQRVAHLCAPASQRRHRLVLYVNFDGTPIPESYVCNLRHADLIFTKSEFSRDVLASSLGGFPSERLDYMYSPADTARFAPIATRARADLRKELLPPWMGANPFVLGWVGRNQWRKQAWLPYQVIHYLRSGDYLVCRQCGQVSLLGWDPARRFGAHDFRGATHEGTRHRATEMVGVVPTAADAAPWSRPGWKADSCQHCGSTATHRAEPMRDVTLWLHMPVETDPAWPVRLLEEQFDLKRDCDIHYTEGLGAKAALAPTSMPNLYNVWDCLLYLSGGEGFGLPAWEAMCSALPVVYSNYSSHAEFLGRGGAGLPVGGLMQPEYETCIWRMIADPAQVIGAVRRLYADRDLGAALGQSGRVFAGGFSLAAQAAKWHTIFQTLLSGADSAGSKAHPAIAMLQGNQTRETSV